MAKKTTLNDLAHLIEKGFAAVASDIADIKRDMATKNQVIALHTQVNSIEAQLRETKIETPSAPAARSARRAAIVANTGVRAA